ncbi:Para-aminobenzoate synthase, aminase component [hydrothermal vent metagenome]|uniref:Para-aminobenzoate synthase, aminase component n=1 Tax=hydrothermal vent metagenome TaxID=652676 RepID=A0A3B1BB52_9ZZZZ
MAQPNLHLVPALKAQPEILTQRQAGLSDLIALQQSNPERYPFLLQSSADGGEANNTRYDILFAFPGERLRLNAKGDLEGQSATESQDFLASLDQWWREESNNLTANNLDLPFQGGWFLYLGYELVAQIETRLQLPVPRSKQPVAEATRIPAAIINDRLKNETLLFTEASIATRMNQLLADLEVLSTVPSLTTSPLAVSMQADPESCYIKQAAQVKRYIYEGDVFQVNLSRKWQASKPATLDCADLYRNLCQQNPAPFSGLAHLAGLTIISSSPERLVRVNKRQIETRPIAGTRPRHVQSEQDRALKSELIAHPKERAEHIMLIDLERNDLGRICQPGSIEVDELMAVESYAHVHHIVSNVRGQLREEISPAEVIRAVFPGGTITGCPKERCMAIIAELEQEARGAYTGSMGYLNLNGDMDLNILIRTISVDAEHITLRAGAGLVADSDAKKELQETVHKARGILLAIGESP